MVVQVILPLGDDPKEKRNGVKAKQNSNFAQQGRIVTGLTGETVCIRRAPDLAAVRNALQAGCFWASDAICYPYLRASCTLQALITATNPLGLDAAGKHS